MSRRKKDAVIVYRVCLGPCGKKFISSGPGNRICRHCAPHMAKAPSFGRKAGTNQDRHRVPKHHGAM